MSWVGVLARAGLMAPVAAGQVPSLQGEAREGCRGGQPRSTERIESEAMSKPSMGKRTASLSVAAPKV